MEGVVTAAAMQVEENQNKDDQSSGGVDDQTAIELSLFWKKETLRYDDLNYNHDPDIEFYLFQSNASDMEAVAREIELEMLSNVDGNWVDCKAEAISTLILLLCTRHASKAMEEIISSFNLEKYIDASRDPQDLQKDVLDALVDIICIAPISLYHSHDVLFDILSHLLDHSSGRPQRMALSQLGRFASSTDDDRKLVIKQKAFDSLLRLCATEEKTVIQRKATSILLMFCDCGLGPIIPKLEMVVKALRTTICSSNDEEVLKNALLALGCFSYNIEENKLDGFSGVELTPDEMKCVVRLIDAQFLRRLVELREQLCSVSDKVSDVVGGEIPQCIAGYALPCLVEFLTWTENLPKLQESAEEFTTNSRFGESKRVHAYSEESSHESSAESSHESLVGSSHESSAESSHESWAEAEDYARSLRDMLGDDIDDQTEDQAVEQSNSGVDKTEQNKGKRRRTQEERKK